MPVALIFTGFTSHPKIRRAGEQAGWLFVHCLEYAAEWGTDGFIPAESIDFGLKNHRQRLNRLLHGDDRFGPLLHPVAGGYEINDYLEWNRRAQELQEKAQAKSEARSKAGRKGAEARWGGRLTDSNGDGKPHGKPGGNRVANGSQTDDSGSGSGSKDHPPVVDLVPTGTARDVSTQDQGGLEPPPDPIVRARKRAGLWPDRGIDTAWTLAACRRTVDRAVVQYRDGYPHAAGLYQDCWDRLEVLAGLDTRSPGRLLEPAAWEHAGRELTRIRRDQANQRAQLAEREARNRGDYCDHGNPGGRGCALCRTEARTA